MREIKANDATAGNRRILINCVDATDYATPEPGEAGGQPQKSVNCGAWTNTSGVLIALDAPNGDYYVELTQAEVNLADITTIETRYKSANTAWAYGRTVKIVANTPADVYSIVNHGTYGLAALKSLIDAMDLVVVNIYAAIIHATYGLSALKTLIDGLVAGVWAYATRKLTSRNITTGENIASQESMLGAVSAGVINNAMTVVDNSIQEIMRGDATPFTINLGTGWPLTGKKVYFIAKADKNAADSTAIFDITCTITDVVNGVCMATLTKEQTAIAGKYYAEIEVRNTDESSPQTAKQFILNIKNDTRKG